jgi:pimeloyl-ACP methyl ester carboxylesterase
MKTMLVSIVGLLVALYGALCAWIYVTQRSMLYFPVPEGRERPAEVLPLRVDGAVLKIWHLARGAGPALLYFGGNAEDVGPGLPDFARVLPQHSLFFVNYRGYGGSSGSPSERALVADAVALYDLVRRDHAEIAVVGRSLGAAVAVQLASQRPVAKLVLVTPFDSAVRLGQALMPWLPVSWLLKDRYDSAGRAGALRCPTLIVIAGDDEVVGRRHADALAAAFAPGWAQPLVVPGAGHNDLQLWPEYFPRIAAFLGHGPAPDG